MPVALPRLPTGVYLACTRVASGQPQRLGEELIIGVLICDVLPRLHHFAVADVEHRDLPILKPPALTLPSGQVHADRVPVIGHHVMQLGPKGPGRQLHRPAEEPEDRVRAAVVAGQRAAAREVPEDLGVEQLRVSMSPLAKAS